MSERHETSYVGPEFWVEMDDPLAGGHTDDLATKVRDYVSPVPIEQDEMDADHVTAWSKGGSTDLENCQMLCVTHNRAKGNK